MEAQLYSKYLNSNLFHVLSHFFSVLAISILEKKWNFSAWQV